MKTTVFHVGLAILAAGVIALIIDRLCPSQESWIFLGIVLFGIALIVVSHYWTYIAPRIPCERIKQDANPSKYVFPTIVDIDNSVLQMYSGMRDVMIVNSVYLTMNIRSQLKFDIVLVSLGGYAVINGIETSPPQAVLENKGDIELTKGDTLSNLKWILYIQDSSCESALKNELRSFVEKDVPNTIKLKLKGWDNKGRAYPLETEQFIIGG